MTRISRALSCVLAAASVAILATGATAQVNPNLYTGLKWRNVGPFHGGRISSVTGVISPTGAQTGTFYVGTPLGGIWKTTSGGATWFPVSDAVTSADSFGAVQVAPSNPDVVYAGAGDPISGSLGNGMWKSTDAGRTWQHIGLEDTVKIDSILVDPADPNLVTVSALGDATRHGGGIHRSTDGGATWTKVFAPAGYDGIRDLQYAYDVPSVMLAAVQGTGGQNGGGGGGRGGRAQTKPAQAFKSTDGGKTWTQIKIPPFEGRIAVAIAQNTKAQRMYIVGNNIENGSGLYRSDDGGATWKHMAGKDTRISNGQGAYSSGVFVDSQNPDVLYTMSTAMYRSTDGGVTFQPFKGAPGGEDYHKLWIDPLNGSRMLVGSDQGASVTLDNGRTWSLWYSEVISQVYHVATDTKYPYHIMAAQQDTGAVMISSRGTWGQVNFTDWSPLPSSEFGIVRPDPKNPDLIYGVGYGAGGGGSGIVKIDMSNGQWENVAPNFGADAAKYHAGRDFQKAFDTAFDPSALYVAYQCLLVSRDGAHTFKAASPDLTTAKGAPQQACGTASTTPPSTPAPPAAGAFSPEVEMDLGQRGPEGEATIADFSISKVKRGILWTVSSNGQIFNTMDSGKTWNNVSNLPDVPPRTAFSTIVAGDDANTAYVVGRIAAGPAAGVNASDAANTPATALDVDIPLIWRTTDGGKSWTSIVNGLPKDERTGSWVNSLRADPKQPGLLFAGTESTVYVSFDNGDHWQSLRQNLPSTSIRDLDVHTDTHLNDLVIGTYGRGFWVLDDITPLREIAAKAKTISAAPAYLFQPEEAIRARNNSNWDQPFSIEVPHAFNVPYGVLVDYYLSHEPTGPIKLDIFDGQNKLVRTIASTPPPPIEGALYPKYWLAPPESRALSTHAGLNRINWDLYYDDPPALRHDLENQMNMTEGSTTPGPHGPQVIPGVYTLKLTVDGQVYTQKATVVNDPRVGESPALMTALRSQNKLTLLAMHGMEQSFAGHDEVEAVRGQLASLTQGDVPADVAAKAKVLEAGLVKVGGVLPAGGFGGGGGRRGPAAPDALQSFLELNTTYSSVVSIMQVGLDMAPTSAQIDTWESGCTHYNQTLAAWKAMQPQISDFNALLTKSNLHPLSLSPTKMTNESTCKFAPQPSANAHK
jgi:photosystem II stability/assembly factor-like uncharacterized protein